MVPHRSVPACFAVAACVLRGGIAKVRLSGCADVADERGIEMIYALLLLVSAVVVCVSAPAVLSRIDSTKYDPALLIGAWLAAIAGVVVAVVGSSIVLLLPGHGLHLIPSFMTSHWPWHRMIAHGASTAVEQVTGIVAVTLFSAVGTCFSVRLVVANRKRIRKSERHIAVLEAVAQTDHRQPEVLRLSHEDPIAFSISGVRDRIVVTDGVFQLGEDAVAAVFAHERAHLRGHHHSIVGYTRVLAECLPFVPLFRHAHPAIVELVELSADASAVQECGDDAVRSALVQMVLRCTPTVALAMADRAIERRLLRLSRRRRRRGPLRRLILRIAAVALVMSIPFPLAVGLLHLVVLA